MFIFSWRHKNAFFVKLITNINRITNPNNFSLFDYTLSWLGFAASSVLFFLVDARITNFCSWCGKFKLFNFAVVLLLLTCLFDDLGRGKPTSVQEFLSMINLMQYTDALQDNGWDNLEFLG